MKKLLSLALVLAMVLTMSVTAFAQEITGESGSTVITYNANESYVVTIPDSMSVGTDANVSVKDVVLASGKELTISVSSTQYNDGWKLKNGDDTIGYTLKIGDTDVANNGTVLTVKSGETATKTLVTAVPEDQKPKYSGSYTDTLTFSVSTALTSDVKTVSNASDLEAALTSGGKIKLTDHITSSVTVSTSTPVVLDLNGKTLTATTDENALKIESGSNVTINDETGSGGIELGYSSGIDGRNIVCFGTVAINGGNYQNSGDYALLFGNNADITINGGIFGDVFGDTGTISINGGTIESFGCNSGVTVYITGGTVKAYTPDNLGAYIQGTTIITGGTFNFDPSATGEDNITVDTTTHTVTNNGDGTWTVTAKDKTS